MKLFTEQMGREIFVFHTKEATNMSTKEVKVTELYTSKPNPCNKLKEKIRRSYYGK